MNSFSVMSGQVFLGLTSTKQRIKCLAQGHNTVPLVKLKPAPLDLESSTLPLGHRASHILVNIILSCSVN